MGRRNQKGLTGKRILRLKRGCEEKGRIIRNKRKCNVKKTMFYEKKRNLKEWI